MNEKIPNIAPLYYQYAFIPGKDVAKPHNLYRIDYKTDEVDKLEVLFIHRLLQKSFGDPSEIECDGRKLDAILPEGCKYSVNIKDGKLIFQPDIHLNINRSELEEALIASQLLEWKYYIRTKHNDILLIQSERVHTQLSIYHVLPNNLKEPNQKTKEEGAVFIDALLREANRQLKGGQLFNLKAEFEKRENVKHYLLHNVYYENYMTALFLLQASIKGEQEIRDGELEHDAADPEVRASGEKMEQIKKYQSVRGVYFAASILFVFMAFEGLINLLYHAFLKDEYREELENISRRLDLEQKLLFMPALCYGFKDELIGNADFLDTFKQLKNLRNALMHAKISDSLVSASFIEQGFFYSSPITKQKEDAFPDHKLDLDGESVIYFHKKVNSLIDNIKDKMDSEHRQMVDDYFMKKQFISFWNDKGKISLTKNRES